MAVDWTEDELYGRYEVSLKMDFGGLEQAMVASQHLRELAREQMMLGYELDVRTIIGGETVRKNGR